MSLNIIDSQNLVVLLKSYEINEKTIRNGKKFPKKQILPEENLNIWLLHLNTIFKDLPNNPEFTDLEAFVSCTTKSEIIHSTAGLFDTCLPDMDLDTIYGSIVDKEAYTIIAFSSPANTLNKIKNNTGSMSQKAKKIDSIEKFLSTDKADEIPDSDNVDIYTTNDEKKDDFKIIFDDEESVEDGVEVNGSESNSTDDETDEDFSLGYNQYIQTIYQRKLAHLTGNIEKPSEIGFENQIAGAISFKIRHVDVRRVVHITMLGVLKPYRGRGVGKYLVNLVLDSKIVGASEAVVVHADYSACAFFKKFGFSDDALLNTQWHSLEPEYTNCSLLTYVRAYSNRFHRDELLSAEFSTAEMEVDIRLWQKKVTEVHCFQFQVFQRMKMEIEHLKATIRNQDNIMKDLMKELREAHKEKVRLENSLTESSKILAEKANNLVPSEIKPKFTSENDTPDSVEYRVKSHFHESLTMVGQSDFMKYVSFSSTDVPPLLLAEHKAIARSLTVFSPRLSSRSVVLSRILYFCEAFSLTKEAKLKILTEGFDKTHRKSGSHGMGYYFSSNPSTAAIYATNNSVIVADVILGNICRNITEMQPLKESAPEGYNSALVASSYINQINNNAQTGDSNSSQDNSFFHSQEFVIFDSTQALPLGLVTYALVDEY